jgi:hypothetical protein
MFIHTETFFFLLIRKFKVRKGFILVHVGGFISKLVIIVHSSRHSIHVISSDIGVLFIESVSEVLILKVIRLIII